MNKQPDTYDLLEITNTDSPDPVRVFVNKHGYEQLRAENSTLKAEIKSIDSALNDPRANLTLTTAEVILEIKAELAEANRAYECQDEKMNRLYDELAEAKKDAELWRDLVSHQKFNNVPAVGYAINRANERQARKGK